MTAGAGGNGFAAVIHRLSLWTTIKKLMGDGANRGGGKAAAPHTGARHKSGRAESPNPSRDGVPSGPGSACLPRNQPTLPHGRGSVRSEEHTSELQSLRHLAC